MKSKESPAFKVLSPDCILAIKHTKHRMRRTSKQILTSVNPAKYKGWSCQLYVVCYHCAN